jgi:signal transduction histidine kinase
VGDSPLAVGVFPHRFQVIGYIKYIIGCCIGILEGVKRMFRPIISGLRVRLFLLVVMGVIPAVSLILFQAAQQRQLVAEDIQASALRLTRLVAADHQRLIEDSRQLLLTLAQLADVRGESSLECSQLFADLLKIYPQYANIGVALPHGWVQCSGVSTQRVINLSNQIYFQEALNKRDFVVGRYQLDPITGKPALMMAYPISGEPGQILAVVFAALDLVWLNQLVTEAQLPESGVLSIVEDTGTILVHSEGPIGMVGQQVQNSPLVQAMLVNREGTSELVGLDGIERLYGFSQVQGQFVSHIYVGIGISKESAFERANAILTRHLLALTGVLWLTLAATWWGSDLFVLRKVKAILKATRRLAAGDLSARTGLDYGEGELSQLARVFDQMGEVLEQRENERIAVETEIKRHIRDLAALNTITAAVSSSLEVPEVLESLKRLLAEHLNAPAGVIFFYQADEDQLLLEAAWGLPSAILADLKVFPIEEFHYGEIIHRREAYFQSDFHSVEPYASSGLSATRPNLLSYLCIPLVAKGEIQGVIDMFSLSPHVFTQDQVDLFATMGKEVGVMIQNARLFEQVDKARERLKMLSQQLIEVQENERRHIARELHDEIGQALTALKVNFQTLSRLQSLDELGPHILESIAIIDRTIQQVRSLSLDLRPSLLDDLGIVAALRWYIDRQAQRAGFEAQFLASPPELRLEADLETTCFRVVQEALTNVVRHAQAQRVRIELQKHQDELFLSVFDDGIGFDPSEVWQRTANDTSLGLLGMRERVQLVGGTIEIISRPEGGTEIQVVFPLVERYRDENLVLNWKGTL